MISKNVCSLCVILLLGSMPLSGCLSIPSLKDKKTDSEAKVEPAHGDSALKAETKKTASNKNSYNLREFDAKFLLEENKGDVVLARVDDEEVKASDLLQIFFMENPRNTREVVRNLVLYILVRKEAERQNVRVDDIAVELLLDRLMKDQEGRITLNIGEDITLSDFVNKEYGMDLDSYRNLVRKTAVYHLLLERLVRFTELRKKRLKLGVLITSDLTKAQVIRKKLENGANFSALVQKNSLDTTGIQGEVWPPLPVDLDNPIVKAALLMNKGDISDVKEADLGKDKVYRIIKLINIVDPVDGTYEDLSNKVEKSLKENPMVIPDLIKYWQDSLGEIYEIETRMS